MELQLIRHATLWLHYGGVQFLIDPMFSDQGANPPIINSPNDRRNPLVPLPFDAVRLQKPDAVIVTHLHKDHWDEAAAALLDKATPVLCQPRDEIPLALDGFSSVTSINKQLEFKGVTLIRTNGQHGTGEIGEKMGQVSGFVFKKEGEPTLYLAGDTIWCSDVLEALDAHRPDITIVNAGGARFTVGDPITMDADDVVAVSKHAPYTQMVAVHMDSINHCLVTKVDLRKRLAEEHLQHQVIVPEDGEKVLV
ncbi:MBL fold metallo-hydrolase [Paenibacillus thalictri]|uniref:MBL fold metallo-hydrolase n=1 Tax=Paenibacillus thalictri TaxID=2527873 RepID=A0A4Q9DY36_9BACL|nr:MBL fold metallo-hydrolase [Paenibacillus thalictri]TBL80803.1 MBL fold metallo-hydrolase [Paenibacillus thalictri]